MPTTKTNRLLALEKTLSFSGGKFSKRSSQKLKRRREKRRASSASIRQGKTQVKAQAFDYDEPIELTYRDDTASYVPVMTYGTEDDDYEDESYEASAFDWDDYEDESYEASTFDWDEDEDESYEASAFDWDEDESDAFEVESFEVDDVENEDDDSPRESQSFSELKLNEKDLVEDLDFSDLDVAKDEVDSSRIFSETDFAKDLQAIMAGEKTYDKDRGGMVSADDEIAMAKSQVPDAPLLRPEESNNPHDVFSKMSEHMPHNQLRQTVTEPADDRYAESHAVFNTMDMSHANSFDLGSISLEQMFDESDKEMDREVAEKVKTGTKALKIGNSSTAHAHSAPLALDEAALVEDFAWMQASMTDDETHPEESNHDVHKALSKEDSKNTQHEHTEVEQSVLTQEKSVQN